MEGSNMNSYDAEQEEAKKKEGKMDTSQDSEADELEQCCGI